MVLSLGIYQRKREEYLCVNHHVAVYESPFTGSTITQHTNKRYTGVRWIAVSDKVTLLLNNTLKMTSTTGKSVVTHSHSSTPRHYL